MNKISLIAIILAVLALAGEAFILSTQRDNDDELYQQAIRNDYRVFAPLLPDTLTLAGERVPLELYYVYEGLDRELSSIMYQQLNTQLVFKRANRFFPEIEDILCKYDIPEDFKYLCVTESSLTNATSPAKAQGFWQLMKVTAEQYGLEVNDEVDMRNDLTAATEAACRFMRSLYNRYGSWTLAAAAYNMGPNGLARQMEAQDQDNYYDLWLNSETARYVYRILAYKLIMQNPQDYGFNLRYCDLYPPLPYNTDTLSGRNINLYHYAKRHGCSYRMLRTMNPWLKGNTLHNRQGKTYTMKLPIANGTKISTLTHGRKDTSLVDRM
ncbi:MAG: lytic transglycosylase domain-containing protein [Bacteroidales bacterium]|nr:lytic transglycosylase domain-containing protein [Bacteroidales bacterium]